MSEKKERRTSILIEKHEITIIRKKSAGQQVFCEKCLESVSAFTPEKICEIFRIDLAEVIDSIKNNKFHPVESNPKMICGNSLKDKHIDHYVRTKFENNSGG